MHRLLLIVLLAGMLIACTTPVSSPTPVLPDQNATAAPDQPAGATPVRKTSPAPTAAPGVTPAAEGAQPALNRLLLLQTPPLQGDDVRLLQERLQSYGYAPGNADGIFGPQTAAAVRRFQLLNQLELDGVVGPETWQALFGSQVVSAFVPQGAWSVFVNGSAVYGGFADGKWHDAAVAGTLINESQTFSIYRIVSVSEERPWQGTGLLTAEGQVTATGVERECPLVEPTVVFQQGPTSSDTWQGFAVAAGWNPQPREVQPGDLNDPALQAATADLLRREGLADPQVRLAQALRTDLEGDGQDEILFVAEHGTTGDNDISGFAQGPGSYVLLGLWRPGTPALALKADIVTKEASHLNNERIEGLLDLNGDASFEIITAVYAGSAGGGTRVYRLVDQRLEEVMGVFYDDGAPPCMIWQQEHGGSKP